MEYVDMHPSSLYGGALNPYAAAAPEPNLNLNLERWRFLENFETARQLKDALDELTSQIKSLFEAHESIGERFKRERKAYDRFTEAMRCVRADVDSKFPEEKGWLETLTQIQGRVQAQMVADIAEIEEQRTAVQLKLDSFNDISSGIRKTCGSQQGECPICYASPVQIAYQCGHCLCCNCHRQKLSSSCHMCGRPTDRTTQLFI
jgi:hypothetical protein